MPSEPGFIEKTWVAVAPDGNEHDLNLRVGFPTPRPDGDWVAEVTLGILDAHRFEIYGVDSWQAMELGMRHAAILVHHHQSRGWRFLWARGGREVSATELYRGV